ncbi:hypothetical protein L195_g004328 [Trifolium pratense]|uniref:Uncharacterized protein n=1 Tax=Trifolium pratense TaxID=57577 RepID=A0A2K3NXP9_TRIPR|nr:hypothetical protein L195_g004328 [Trifolium pratense]
MSLTSAPPSPSLLFFPVCAARDSFFVLGSGLLAGGWVGVWLWVVRWLAAPLASLGLFRTDLLVLVCLVADEVGSFIYFGGLEITGTSGCLCCLVWDGVVVVGGVAVLMRWGLAVPRQRGLQILFCRHRWVYGYQCVLWLCSGAALVALGLGGFGDGVPPMGCWFCLDFAPVVFGYVVFAMVGVFYSRMASVAGLLRFKNIILSVKTLSLLSFVSLRRQSRNQIANVDFLLIPDASSDLHRAGCVGGLQFARICVECV